MLAALARDDRMAEAARDKDLYAGIAAQGFGGDRAKAKVALLGAIYGATTGESGRLMPQLTRTYPRAVGFVEDAARAGEKDRRGLLRLAVLGIEAALAGWMVAGGTGIVDWAYPASSSRSRLRSGTFRSSASRQPASPSRSR